MPKLERFNLADLESILRGSVALHSLTNCRNLKRTVGVAELGSGSGSAQAAATATGSESASWTILTLASVPATATAVAHVTATSVPMFRIKTKRGHDSNPVAPPLPPPANNTVDISPVSSSSFDLGHLHLRAPALFGRQQTPPLGQGCDKLISCGACSPAPYKPCIRAQVDIRTELTGYVTIVGAVYVDGSMICSQSPYNCNLPGSGLMTCALVGGPTWFCSDDVQQGVVWADLDASLMREQVSWRDATGFLSWSQGQQLTFMLSVLPLFISLSLALFWWGLDP